jgi:serine/threonine protein kinase
VYEVVAQIGEGGMGAVYRATDTSLGRQVAIKVLPDAFAANPDRLARFEREAKTLASLNHPHIAAIYGFEKSAHQHALVMELVEGEDLSQRIARGAIPLNEALPIAQQIAEALEEAHEHGIIHRDLKPANVKVRNDGTVKVLDFGLAKAIEPAGSLSASASLSPTITTPAMTQAGMILGTAAYMSPEQARGIDVDKRTDLWAFGVVLWEMLTGARLFEGATVSDALAAVLRAEPPWARLPNSTPAGIRRLLRRCLEKDRKRRLDSASVARLEIEETMTAVPALEGGDVPAAQPLSARNTAAPWIVSAVMGLLAVAAVLYGLGIGERRAGPPVNAVPVVVLMDTSAPRGVYDPRTRQNSGTNVDGSSNRTPIWSSFTAPPLLTPWFSSSSLAMPPQPGRAASHPPPKARRRLRSFSAITCPPPAWTSWKRSSGTSEERIPEPGSSSTPETGPTRRVSHGNRTWFDDFPR